MGSRYSAETPAPAPRPKSEENSPRGIFTLGEKWSERYEELSLESERLRARQVLWWVKWPRAWRQIGDQPGIVWWSAWDSLWRKLGAERERPFVWSRAWLLAWEAIGQQRFAEEAAKVRRIIEAAVHERTTRQSFWATWIGMWTDIGKREAGVMAAWRPICRSCRQNLTRDHSCP